MIDVKVHRRNFEPEVKGDLGFLVSRRDVGDQRASPIESKQGLQAVLTDSI